MDISPMKLTMFVLGWEFGYTTRFSRKVVWNSFSNTLVIETGVTPNLIPYFLISSKWRTWFADLFAYFIYKSLRRKFIKKLLHFSFFSFSHSLYFFWYRLSTSLLQLSMSLNILHSQLFLIKVTLLCSSLFT